MVVVHKTKKVVKTIMLLYLSALLFTNCNKKTTTDVFVNYIPKKEHTRLLIDAKRELLFQSVETAESKLVELVRQDSLYHTAHFELAKLYASQKNFLNAEYHAEKAYKLQPDNYHYQLLYLQLLLNNHKDKNANELMALILKKNENSIEFYYDVLELLSSYNKTNELLNVIYRFEKKFGYQDDIIIAKCQILLEKKNYKSVVKYLQNILKVDSSNAVANSILGDFYLSTNNLKRAILHFNEVLKADPNNPKVNAKVIELFLQLDNFSVAFQKFDEIIYNTGIDVNDKIQILTQFFSKADKLNEEYNKKLEGYILTFKQMYNENPFINYVYGELMFRKRDFESAINAFEITLKNKPDNLELWNLILYLSFERKDYIKIVSLSSRALMIFPSNRDFYMYRGYAYLNLDSLENSYEDFKMSLKLTGSLDKTKKDILHSLAEVTHRLNMNEESFIYYELILQENPNDIVALNNYAYFLALQGKDLQKALEMSLKTIKVEPKNHTYLDTYAYILFRLKNFAEALTYIEYAVLYGGGQNSTILEHYGDILFFNGQVDQAIAAWKEALERGGTGKLIEKINSRTYVED